MLLDSSTKNGSLGLGFILDFMSDAGSIRHFLIPKMPLEAERGSDWDYSHMKSSRTQLEGQQLFEGEE
jgi:hypothetical protein